MNLSSLSSLIRLWLAPPIFADVQKTRTAKLLNTILIAIITITAVLTLTALAIRPDNLLMIYVGAVTIVLASGLLIIMKRSYIKLASTLLSFMLLVNVTIIVYIAGAVRGPIVTVYLVAIIIAGLLLGNRAAILFMIVCGILLFGLMEAESAGLLNPTPIDASLNQWVKYMASFFITVVLVSLSVDSANRAAERAERNEQLLRETVTELQSTTRQLQNYQEHLEELVQEQTSALTKQTEALLRTNAELRQFAYVAAHDLREPLRTVRVYTERLEQRYKDKIDERADKYIGYIVDGATRMYELITALLAYAQLEQAKASFATRDVNKILAWVLADLNTMIGESGAMVTYNHLPVLMVDATQIMKLFQNLISNGIKFQAEEKPQIAIQAVEQEHDWLFSVSDNGIGLGSQYKERIFEIFQRAHSQAEYPGTGIGLAICKKIVENHNGRIWLESKLSQGTTVYFTLPK